MHHFFFRVDFDSPGQKIEGWLELALRGVTVTQLKISHHKIRVGRDDNL